MQGPPEIVLWLPMIKLSLPATLLYYPKMVFEFPPDPAGRTGATGLGIAKLFLNPKLLKEAAYAYEMALEPVAVAEAEALADPPILLFGMKLA